MSAAKKIPAPPAPRLLPPPKGYSSWLAYAVATMETRSLRNDNDWGHQSHWQTDVTCEQMKAAAMAELTQIEGIWSEMERAWAGKIETTAQLAEWAEKELAKRETAEISANPAASEAIERHKSGRTKFAKISDIRTPKKRATTKNR